MRKNSEPVAHTPEIKTPLKDTSTQTPIEIAIKIDENGMTTASQLYSFLELNPSNFSKWCNRNIKNNKFATENVDYFRFVLEYESATNIKSKTRTDYHLTSDFAKKLSMTGNSERHEQARDYFIACEQGLKIATNKLKSQQYDMSPLFDAITTLTQTITSMQQDISSIKESSQKKKLPEKKYSRWKTNTFSKLNTLTQYANENSDQTLQLKDTIHITINEFEDTYNIELSDYVQAYKSEFDIEPDVQPYAIDVINHYKDIREMYSLTLDHIMDKLNLKTKDVETDKNIFDILAENLATA